MEPDRARTDAGGQVNTNAITEPQIDDDGFRRRVLVLAAISGALAVSIGAFGAHALPDWLTRMGLDAETIQRRLAQFDTGARYHLTHAVVLLVIAGLPVRRSAPLTCSVWLFALGTMFFSGSLYLLVLTNTPWLGAITPIGGASWWESGSIGVGELGLI